MNIRSLSRLLLGLTLLALTGCAPQALYFHESTKMSFSAGYTASDSEPLSTSFGYKRRIVAVVPGKNRTSPTGREADAQNEDEALSTISKFYVKAGTQDGLVIKNNFATGLAAQRLLTKPVSATVAVAGLMHATPVLTDSTGQVVDANGTPSASGATASDVAAARVARIKSKMIGGGGGAASHNNELDQTPVGVIKVINGVTCISVRRGGKVIWIPYKQYLEEKKKSEGSSGGNKGSGNTNSTGTSSSGPGTNSTSPTTTPATEPLPTGDPLNAAPDAEIFVDKTTGKTMRRIKKPDGSVEVVPFKP